jgi:hypothetical protein
MITHDETYEHEHGDAEPTVVDVEQSAVRRDGWTTAGGLLQVAAIWVGVAVGVVFIGLGFRLGFKMGEANPNNGFVDFIYDATDGLVAPFDGIAADRTLDSGGIFEPETALAMSVYLIAALMVMTLLWALAAAPALYSRDTYEERRRRTAVRHPH